MAVKLAKKQKKKENTGKLVTTSFLEYLTVLWVIVMSFAIALYMEDGYFQIGTAKYDAYAHVVVFGLPVLIIVSILYMIFACKETGISGTAIKTLGKSLSVTDWFMLSYTVFVLLSFFGSGHIKEAFWGYSGWYMGLFSQLSFVLVYFICSRFLKDYPVVLGALCIVTFYVYVIGILHRLLIDPIGVYDNLENHYKNMFLSTMGQASWYSSFMITVLPLGMFAYWYFENKILRLLSGVFVFAGFMTLVSQNSDSAYFGFAAAMLVLFHVSVTKAGRMRRFFELALLFLLAPKAMWLLLKVYPNEIMWWDTISRILLTGAKVWIWAAVCIGMIVIFAVMEKKDRYPLKAMKMVRTAVYIIFGVLLLLCVGILIAGAQGWLSATMIEKLQRRPYLVWSRTWGNGRGFTWSFTAQMFAEMSWKNKMLGVGPDCYAIYAHANYNELIRSKWEGSILTNAHNEWLNAFVNTGCFGGVAYLGIFVSALVRFVKKSQHRPVLLGAAACIAAYMGHNLFCYQQVLCTPFIFVFMAIGEYQMRKKEH